MKPPLRLPRSATLSPRRGVVDLMGALEVAGVAPDAPLLVGGGHDPATASLRLAPHLTRHQLEARVTRRADALSSQVRPGVAHPLGLRPDAEGVVELLAMWRLGAVPAPLNPKLTEAERAAARAGEARGRAEHALGQTTAHRDALQAQLAELRSSRAYRLAERLSRIRRRLMGDSLQ